MVDYLEALEKIGSGIDADRVKDIFEHESEYESFDIQARQEGHISITKESDKRVCRLTPKGTLYVKSKKTELFKMWYRKPEWWSLLFSTTSIFAVIIAYFSLNAQINSIIPNKPVLEIFSEEKNLPAWEIVNYGTFLELPIHIRNVGGADTQHITIRAIDDEQYPDSELITSTIGNIENVKAGTTGVIEEFYIQQKSCIYNERNCNASELPVKVKIPFEFTCINCEQQKFTKLLEFCIWHASSIECEK